LQQGNTVQVRNPAAVRPWQHVLEPLTGYLVLGALLNDKPEAFARAYNFGPVPEDHLTVKELVTMAINIWGQGTWTAIADAHQPHEATLLQLDISRAIAELQWRPKLTAADAINWTIQWYKQPLAAQAGFTFQQIENYCSL
jgi:CDP-glucose 4,6-dehydratase